MRQFPWVALLALLIGLTVGVLYAWVISPVRYVDTAPNTLRADFKDSFRTVIASSYAANHNLLRAKARLALLGDTDSIEALTAQAQRMLAAGEPFKTVQNVAELASDLRPGTASVLPSATTASISRVRTSTPAASPSPALTQQVSLAAELTATEPVPTSVPFDTPTPRPSRTPIPTASAPFQLISQDQVCNTNLTDGLMQVSVLDSHRHQMPGVEIDISWSGGEETFFTGLKPEIADGYADYVMKAGMMYVVHVGRAGSPVSGLTAPSCPDTGGQTYLGGLKLVFQQP